MALGVLAMVLQLQAAALGGSNTNARAAAANGDSVGDARRARTSQASFERFRRANLPWEAGSGGRCEVRLGRFCWWYDESAPVLPPEADAIRARRMRLLDEIDSLATLHPGDDWLAGLRVHYRIDAREHAAADSAARRCRATRWWCDALLGYAAHVGGDAARADSSFRAALAGMDDETRCRWTNIHVLLPNDARERYEALACADRTPVDRRYWLLGRPRLAAAANDWRSEFFTRRVQSWIAERARTPHNTGWGADAEELVLRYGWPVVWGRVQPSSVNATAADANIVGHDPSPSFVFGPREALLDSLAEGGDDGWDLRARLGEARYAPRGVRRVATVASQVARFRRGDSTLVAAAFTVSDDSLRVPATRLSAALGDTIGVTGDPRPLHGGTATLLLASAPLMVEVESLDSITGTLARGRTLFRAGGDAGRLSLSDLLLYRAETAPASGLEIALARAIPGDTVGRDRPVGLFWETYGLAETGESVDVAVTVERVDRGWFRSARQVLGLSDADTPLRMRWTDARASAGNVAPHAVSIDLANLPGGRYRLTLSLTRAGTETVTSAREIELREP